MKCLSFKQPFADLVVSGKKTIELRNWNTNFRGTFLVHASGNIDGEACDYFKMPQESFVRRAAIGQAELYRVKKYLNSEEFARDQSKHLATGKYTNDKYGFELRNPVRFGKPIYIPGKLGFFEVDLPRALS